MTSDLARVTAFLRRLEELTSTRSAPWRFGTVRRNDDFPRRWDSNLLRVERPTGRVTVGELAAEADRHLGDLAHREIVVEDHEDGARLAPGFAELGWEVDHLLVMTLVGEPAAPAAQATELTFDRLRPLIVEVGRRAHWGADADDAEMLADFRRELIRAADARFFGCLVADVVVAACELYRIGDVAQIEDVNTLEEHRGRGFASAFVSLAAREATAAGAEVVFLLTEETGRARAMYERLGFAGAGRFWWFTRQPRKAPEPAR